MKIDLTSEKSLAEMKSYLEKERLRYEAEYGWVHSFRLEIGQVLSSLEKNLDLPTEIKIFEKPNPPPLESIVSELEIIIPDFFTEYGEIGYEDEDFEHSEQDSLDYRIKIGLINDKPSLSLEIHPSSISVKDGSLYRLDKILKVFELVKTISTEINNIPVKYARLYSLEYNSPFSYPPSQNPDQLILIK